MTTTPSATSLAQPLPSALNATGILVQGNRAIVNNAGTINVGASGAAIDVFGDDAIDHEQRGDQRLATTRPVSPRRAIAP